MTISAPTGPVTPVPGAHRAGRPPRRPYTVVIADELGCHAAAWDALGAAAPLASPFLRSWWFAGLDAARTPCFVLVHHDGRLVGGLALQRRRVLGVDLLTALGGGRLCPDHLDLVADPAHEAAVVDALGSWFRGRGSRVLDLDGLQEDARVIAALPRARVAATDVAPYEPLPADPADYRRARGSRFHTKAGRGRRRLERAGVVFRRTPDAQVPAALDDFDALHGVREERQELLRHRAEIRAFVLAGVTAGEVRVYETVRDDVRHAVLIGFTTGGRWATYQLARTLDHDLRDVGTVLHIAAIEDACTTGLTEVDFLRGSESYKATFTTRARPLLRVRAAHGLRGRLVLRTMLALAGARRAVTQLRGRGDASEEPAR